MGYNWFFKSLVSALAALDIAIYGLLGIVINIILSISDITISGTATESFTDRIYVVLAVYVIFRLGITLLNAVANPELLTDQKKGVGEFLKRTVIAMFLLLFVPTIFKELISLQGPILETIPKIVLGVEAGEIESDDTGHLIAKTTLVNLMTPNECKTSDAEKNLKAAAKNNNWWQVITIATESCEGLDGGEKIFKYKYPMLYSFIIGIIFLIVMISFVVDIAIRTVKMMILEIIAPIPIVSYMDPTSKGDTFSSWTGEIVKTYISLFTKMATIYLILYLITQIFYSPTPFLVTASGEDVNPFAKVLLVLGIIFFAKALPGYISKLLGVKEGGSSFAGISGIVAGGMAFASGSSVLGALSGGVTTASLAASGEGSFKDNRNKGLDKAQKITHRDPDAKHKSFSDRRLTHPDYKKDVKNQASKDANFKKAETAMADSYATMTLAGNDVSSSQKALDTAQFDYNDALSIQSSTRAPAVEDFSGPNATVDYADAYKVYEAEKFRIDNDVVEKRNVLENTKNSHDQAIHRYNKSKNDYDQSVASRDKAKQELKSVSERVKSHGKQMEGLDVKTLNKVSDKFSRNKPEDL